MVPARRPPIAPETVAPIREMAVANRLWGAERIRGALLKPDIRVAKSTIQRSLREARPPRRAGQAWVTSLRNHAGDTRACDLLPITDLLFRPLFAFVVGASGSCRVVYSGVTRHPTDTRVAQQRREATPFGQWPRYLIRDNDRKYGPAFARVAAASGSTELRTAYRAPRQNATCERFLGGVRREYLDRLLIPDEAHLRRVLREHVWFFNHDRPHQDLAQQIPGAPGAASVHTIIAGSMRTAGSVRAIPILGGLHHAYAQAA